MLSTSINWAYLKISVCATCDALSGDREKNYDARHKSNLTCVGFQLGLFVWIIHKNMLFHVNI